MSNNLGNVSVKSTDFLQVKKLTNAFLRTIKQVDLFAYVSEPINGFCLVFPYNEFAVVGDLAQFLSTELKTLATGAFIYGGKDINLQLYNQGVIDFRYIWDKLGKFQQIPDRWVHWENLKSSTDIAKNTTEKDFMKFVDAPYTDSQQRYKELIDLLGFPACLVNWGYSNILEAKRTEQLDRAIQSGELPKIELVKRATID
jgi:hypothetical protein